MNALKVTVVHEGVTYSADVMTIESTRLGIEDHGIMSAMLHCKADLAEEWFPAEVQP
jgi:hypothetical protein